MATPYCAHFLLTGAAEAALYPFVRVFDHQVSEQEQG